jgi:L-malate glycosyltransferase
VQPLPRILHVVSWYPNPDDPVEGRFIADRIAGLQEWCDNDVVHIRIRPSARPEYRRLQSPGVEQLLIGLPLVRWKWIEWIAARVMKRVWIRMRHKGYDAVAVHVAYPLMAQFESVCAHFDVPVIISEHWSAYHYGFHLPPDSRALPRMRRMFDRAAGVICVSGQLAQDIRHFTGRDDLPTDTVYNPVDSGMFFHDPQTVRRDLLSINRWVDVKNPFLLLDAWRMVVQRGTPHRLIIGGDGPLLPEMKRRAEEYGLTDSVTFTGLLTREQVAQTMRSVIAYVTPSRFETFSVSCAEALMSGTPVACTPLEAVREYAPEGDAVFAGAHTPEALSAAISQLLADAGRADHAAIASRARALLGAGESNARYFRSLMRFAGYARSSHSV